MQSKQQKQIKVFLMQTFGVALPTSEDLTDEYELNAAVYSVSEAAGLEETKNSQAE